MKKITMFILALTLVLSAISVAAVPVDDTAVSAKAANNYMCIGYVYQGHYTDPAAVDVIDVTKLTHINYAFALLNQTTYVPELQETEILTRIRNKIKNENPNVKLMLSIGGWEAKGFCYAAQTEERREAFAQTCLDLMNTYGFDGIDIDWEYPGGAWGAIDTLGEAVDRANYTLLCQAVRDKIGEDKLLSIAGGASQSAGVDCAAMSGILDYVNLMTYDYGAYNNSDFDSTKNYANAWVNAGFPKDRINIGMPFYGRVGNDWPVYSTIVDYLNSGGAVTTGSSESYLTYNGNKISFDSPEMIRNKILWIKQQGFAGGMTWELSQDLNNDLLNVMWSNLNGDGNYQSPYMPIPGIAAQPLVLSGVSCNKSGSVEYGDSITWVANITGGTAPIQYKFDVVRDGAVISQGAYGASAAFTFTPPETGQYQVNVSVKDAQTTVSASSALLNVTEPYIPVEISEITASHIGSVAAGTPVIWKASAEKGTGALNYAFDVYKDGTKLTTGAYSASDIFSYTPQSAGSYTVAVRVKDDTGAVVSRTSEILAVVEPLAISALAPVKDGNSVTCTVKATGGSPYYQYSYYVLKDGKVYYSTAYTAAESFTFTAADPGTYSIRVYVNDQTALRVVKTTSVTF